MTTGLSRAASSSHAIIFVKRFGSSVFSARWIVLTAYERGANLRASKIVDCPSARATAESAISYMTSPTACTPSVIPSAFRLRTAVCVGQKAAY